MKYISLTFLIEGGVMCKIFRLTPAVPCKGLGVTTKVGASLSSSEESEKHIATSDDSDGPLVDELVEVEFDSIGETEDDAA